MNFQVHANGAGKRITVTDRVAGGIALDEFVDADVYKDVTVGSPDGVTGNIDVKAQMLSNSPINIVLSDYPVKVGEVVEVPDV